MRHTYLFAALLALCSVDAAAQATFNVPFDQGNVGGWTYGPPQLIEPNGGNPGSWLHTPLVDTFAPMLRSTALDTPFTGDYRAAGVTALGFDLITVSTQFPFAREATLILSDDQGNAAYWLGTEQVPQPAEGWKAIDYAVPSQSATMPAGWISLNGGDPDAVWNAVITNVTQVMVFYGDPTFFFIFDQWNVGCDNMRLTYFPTGENYCTGKLNSAGCIAISTASGTPSATDPSPFVLGAVDVVNQKPGLVFYGLAPAAIPFQGGTLCVQPPVGRTLPQSSSGNVGPADCSGAYALDFNVLIQAGAPGLVAGAAVYTQHWYRDPMLADGFGTALSDGLLFAIRP